MVEKLVELLVKSLVSQPSSVSIASIESPELLTVQIKVAPQDVARVIGSEGRIFRALRTVAAFAGQDKNKEIVLEVVK